VPDTYFDTTLDLIQERMDSGSPEVQAALRSILREVAPDRLLPPQPPVGAVLEYDGPSGRQLLQRTRKGYRHLSVEPYAPNPELDWRYVSKLPGLTQLVRATTPDEGQAAAK
jgi:hypothetical protein